MNPEEQVIRLQQELVQKSKDVERAAEIGNALLEQNKDLEEELEKLSETHCNAIEELEQQKYNLQLKLDGKEKLDGFYTLEIEAMKNQLEKEYLRKEDLLKSNFQRDINKMEKKNKGLLSDLERTSVVEIQLKEKIEELKKLSESQGVFQSQLLSTSATEETIDFHAIIADMEQEKAHLRIELKDKKDETVRLIASKEAIEQQVAELNDELMQKERESISYFNALEKCRENVVDLQLQLDNIQLDTLNTKQKGNSLFGEVEDKRKEIERKYISMKVKYEAINTQLKIKNQQISKMKFQIATLFQMSSSRADSSHMEHLREQLNQSQHEVRTLTDRLNKYEKNQVSDRGDDALVSADSLERTKYTEYLKKLISTSNEKLNDVQDELQTQRMLLMAKNDSLLTCERKLYASQILVDQEKAKNIKLVLKIDELKRKLCLEPDVPMQKERETWVEKLPIKPKEDNTENESTELGEQNAWIDVRGKKNPIESELLPSNAGIDVRGKKNPIESELLPSIVENNANSVDTTKYKKFKKSVSVSEVVEVVTETGIVNEVQMKSGDDDDDYQKSSGKKVTEDKKPKGKKYHKVVYIKNDKANEPECAQQ
ncbi:protein Spindly-A-like isoform X2 [Antedon mediterranea]|uniref:protein Spindly-A-like isoform X2 n=1 Tax=Antedon mediterranea TaxID=105859 RepID=UPI003AF80C3B